MDKRVTSDPFAIYSEADLVAEANHRIANNITVLAGLARLRGSDVAKTQRTWGGDEVRLMFEEFGVRLDAVAQLHRLLAGGQAVRTIELTDHLRAIATGLVSCLTLGSEFSLQIASEGDCRVPPEKALPLGLIVGELVTNAVKYAHPAKVPGRIKVECSRTSTGGLTVEVSDDGVGLPQGLDPLKSGCLGFRLMRSLAEQAGATIRFDSDELGLRVELQMAAFGTEEDFVGAGAA